ncbi:hypothetical protein I7I51_09070 [Histoplasma capsulatum]|uniref:Uncharacterized protein n=1 Tax=Ajellomyces capsulatus TaxID=5037 RepID=A0A8A1M4R5_AJECA|nr:hypothetical protein I7I51_09070 [Histoplasma capsulatum]
MNRRSEIGQQTGEEKRGESTVTTARISYGANGRLGHSVQNRRWEGVRSSWVLRLDDRQKSDLVTGLVNSGIRWCLDQPLEFFLRSSSSFAQEFGTPFAKSEESAQTVFLPSIKDPVLPRNCGFVTKRGTPWKDSSFQRPQ